MKQLLLLPFAILGVTAAHSTEFSLSAPPPPGQPLYFQYQFDSGEPRACDFSPNGQEWFVLSDIPTPTPGAFYAVADYPLLSKGFYRLRRTDLMPSTGMWSRASMHQPSVFFIAQTAATQTLQYRSLLAGVPRPITTVSNPEHFSGVVDVSPDGESLILGISGATPSADHFAVKSLAAGESKDFPGKLTGIGYPSAPGDVCYVGLRNYPFPPESGLWTGKEAWIRSNPLRQEPAGSTRVEAEPGVNYGGTPADTVSVRTLTVPPSGSVGVVRVYHMPDGLEGLDTSPPALAYEFTVPGTGTVPFAVNSSAVWDNSKYYPVLTGSPQGAGLILDPVNQRKLVLPANASTYMTLPAGDHKASLFGSLREGGVVEYLADTAAWTLSEVHGAGSDLILDDFDANRNISEYAGSDGVYSFHAAGGLGGAAAQEIRYDKQGWPWAYGSMSTAAGIEFNKYSGIALDAKNTGAADVTILLKLEAYFPGDSYLSFFEQSFTIPANSDWTHLNWTFPANPYHRVVESLATRVVFFMAPGQRSGTGSLIVDNITAIH